MKQYLFKKTLLIIMLASSSIAAAGNNELLNFLKKQGFPAKPSEDFFILKGLSKELYKYGSNNNACKKSGEFYYAESFNENSDPWFGVVNKTVVESDKSKMPTPDSGNILREEYDKIRKKFGKPTEDVYSPLTGFLGGKKMLYNIDYQGTPLEVQFYVAPFDGCLVVKTKYFKPSKSKARSSAIEDALK